MGNPLRAEVSFGPVDGVPGFETGGRVLFDWNTLCSLQDAFSEEIEKVGALAMEQPKALRTVIRIALEEHHGQVADRIVGKLISAIGAEGVALLMDGFVKAFPEAAAAGAGNPPKPAVTPATNGTPGAVSESGASSASTRKRSGKAPRVSSRR